MKLSKIVIAAAVVAAGASSLSTSAIAQAKEAGRLITESPRVL